MDANIVREGFFIGVYWRAFAVTENWYSMLDMTMSAHLPNIARKRMR